MSGRPSKSKMRTAKSMSVLEFVASDDGGRPRVVQMQNLYDLTMEPPKEHPIPIQITTRRSDGRHEIMRTTTSEVAEAARNRANSALEGDYTDSKEEESEDSDHDKPLQKPATDVKPFRPSTPPRRPKSATPGIYGGKRPGSGRKPRTTSVGEKVSPSAEEWSVGGNPTARGNKSTLGNRVSSARKGRGQKSPPLEYFEAPERAHTAAVDNGAETALNFGEYQPPLTAYEPSLNAEARATKHRENRDRTVEGEERDVECVRRAAKEVMKTGHRPQSSRGLPRARSGRRRPPVESDKSASDRELLNRRKHNRTELEEANDELRHWEMEMARLRGEPAAPTGGGEEWSAQWKSQDDRDFDAIFGQDRKKTSPQRHDGNCSGSESDVSEDSRASIDYDVDFEDGKSTSRKFSSDDEWGHRRKSHSAKDRVDMEGEDDTVINEVESFGDSDFEDFDEDDDTHPGTFGSTLGNEFLSLFA